MAEPLIIDAVRKPMARGKPGGRYGLQTMCEAGGMANAAIIERL
ncbi:hypothetical protein NSE01_33850 [Novosphingobium sediminis]|uniref:Thiolase C-terminal domain-containing protein n=1 Tax=Novosphingobium sediminis TaxID=707214 RepID=A0A512APB4_9SPHN|nr:hypothetical protein [Novosphingobium sediminis]GEO01553.1 hypothetical protein NSE01_33850 [Novosphingobium sediminis]